MALASRFLHALSLVWLIFASYSVQFGLERLLRRRRGAAAGRDARPSWLARRRQRVHARNAERLLSGIVRLHGVYVKLGQVLSIMVGLLPRAFRERLSTLQDAVPACPFAEIERAFVASLGRRPAQCYAEIDPTPVASASLGQVHAARLHDGQKVAVKVLYPRIREIIRLDMRVLGIAMRLFERILPVRDLESVHDALVDLLGRETDYVHEAACMRRMAANFAGAGDVLFPEVIDELSSSDVLTMTFMEGIKITRLDLLEQQAIDSEAVGRRLLQCFFEQLFVHRYFHADPHPGNFLVQAGSTPDAPRLVILDFGAVSEAPQVIVEGLIEAMVAFFSRDGDKLLAALDRMGFVAAEADRELVQKTLLMYFQRLLQLGARTPAALMSAPPERLRRLLDPELELGQLRELARSFQSPPGWFYIERALVMMFGLCGEIAPQLDMLQVGFPYVMPLLKAQSDAHRDAG